MRRFFSPRLSLRALLVGVMGGIVAWGLLRFETFKVMDEWLFDRTLIYRGTRSTQTNVIVVGIDDKTLDELQKPTTCLSPELAEAVDYLHQQGAAAIGIDLLIPESLKDWKDLEYEAIGDADKFGIAIQKAGNVVLTKWLSEKDGEKEWQLPLPQWRIKSFIDPKPTDLGFVNLTEDPDQYVRRQRLCTGTVEALHPHFALALYAVANDAEIHWDGENQLTVGAEPVTLKDGMLRINYAGPPGQFPILSLRDLLEHQKAGTTPQGIEFKKAIVIIGVTSRTGQDFHPTPYANRFQTGLLAGQPGLMNGTELHANIIATLNDNAAIREVPAWVMLILLTGLGAGLAILLTRLNLLWGAVLTMAVLCVWHAVALGVLVLGQAKLEILSVQLLGAGLFTITFGLRWQRLRRMMGVVITEDITRGLESGRISLDLRGELRTVTVLFSDIRNFTQYSSHHSPHEVVTLLNTYFSAIVPLIEKHKGIINQYMGDGIMVLFNAPKELKDHSAMALKAAVEIVQCVRELQANGTWDRLDFPNFRIGVGIHRGEAVVGTIGSPNRLDYSAIGDTVNIASRIEAENKTLGTEILISGEMRKQISSDQRRTLHVTDEASLVTVKGVPHPIQVYPVVVPPKTAAKSAADNP